MRVLLPVALVLTLILPTADAVAEPTGKVSVIRDGELDGFTRDGKLHHLNSLGAFIRFTDQAKARPILKRCGFQRALIENLDGPPKTDAISTSTRFKTAAGARRCARKSTPGKGRKINGLPHSKLFLIGEGDHPGRNLRFVVGRTAYLVGFSPTPSFDPGDSGLIAAAMALYGRVV